MLAFVFYILIWVIVSIMLWITISIISILNIEEPEYTVVENDWKFEIRDYAPYIFAQVEVTGPREQAIWIWFWKLASYIFWDNKTLKRNPNYQHSRVNAEITSESIKMTAPFIDIKTGNWTHIVQFIMPRKYSIKNLPVPSNSDIKILENPMTRRAVLKYGWITNSNIIDSKTRKLEVILWNNKIPKTGDIYSAQYNPPMTFPLLKRNEIMVDIW